MEHTVFNPAQSHILQIMSYMKDDKQIDELDRVLPDYYAKRVDDELDKFVADGRITPETIEDWGKEHMRTPYEWRAATPDDNKFVDCAISAGAEYIVLNDNHFNVLKTIPFPKVTVMTIKEFMNMLE